MKSSLPQFWEHFKSSHETNEEFVSEKTGSYRGLSFEALYSSYEDLLAIFKNPFVNGTFADLGCGGGQAVLLYAHLFPDRKSIGVEFEEKRISAGIKIKEEFHFQNAELIHADLSACEIPPADTYFLYFPTGPVLDRILNELYRSKCSFTLIAIESHGDLLPRLNLENWLTVKDEIPLSSKRHHPFAKVYVRNHEVRSSDLIPFDLSFKEMFLFIQDGREIWIGESKGMEWTSDDRFELENPPRTIYWKDVKKLMILNDLKSDVRDAVVLRRMGELQITTKHQTLRGFIRKIIVDPSFVVEISTGEKVEWKDILTIHQGSRLCFESSSQY